MEIKLFLLLLTPSPGRLRFMEPGPGLIFRAHIQSTLSQYSFLLTYTGFMN